MNWPWTKARKTIGNEAFDGNPLDSLVLCMIYRISHENKEVYLVYLGIRINEIQPVSKRSLRASLTRLRADGLIYSEWRSSGRERRLEEALQYRIGPDGIRRMLYGVNYEEICRSKERAAEKEGEK